MIDRAEVQEKQVKIPRLEQGRDEPRVLEAESNAIVKCKRKSIPIDEPIPIDPLLVFRGEINGIPVKILKDDGCNTNVVGIEFLKKPKTRELFKIQKEKIEVSHSRRGSTEEATEVIINGTLKIGPHTYKSNWVVADCRYDVLLGMPWHVAHNPDINYKNRTVHIGNQLLPVESNPPEIEPEIRVMNLGVKKFRKMLKGTKNDNDFQVFQVFQKSDIKGMKGSQKSKQVGNLIEKYREVFRDELPDGLPPIRTVDHEIEVEKDSKPPLRPLFQLSPAELKAAKEYVEGLLKKGKIRPSKSPYGAPLFFVKEKDKLRGVVDYRALNRITKRNNAPLPRSDEMFDRLGGAKYFSKLDLKTGFHQIRVKPEDIEKTAFNTKYGQFEYLVMPMGLCNAPATFQTLMNQIFYDCIDVFMVVYMDDLLIFSKDEESHYRNLETVLRRLKEHQLYASPKKCEFFQTEIDFLGFLVGKDGMRVNPEKVDVLRTWPTPESLTELRSFLGLLQFFRRFIPKFSAIAAPLTNLTKKEMGIGKWNEKCDEAFQKLKDAIVQAPILVAPDWKKPFRGHVDASQLAVGGTLTQLDRNGKDRVVSFFSKKLTSTEADYTANDRELLGLISFLERFRCYLEGSEFEIFTDNQVLKSFFTKPKLSRKEARWLETLGNFGIFPITLKPGKIHVLGDTLSRAPHVIKSESGTLLNSLEVPFIEFEDVITRYDDDQFFGPIVRAMDGKFPNDEVQKRKLEKVLPMFSRNGQKLLYNGKVCVPRRSVSSVLQLAHDSKISGHFKFLKTLSRLEKFHWRHKTRDVRKYVDGCMKCQQYRDSNQKKLTDPMSLEVPERRWGSLATDFIVSLPKTKDGYDAIITWVDRLTRRVHFLKAKGTDTAEDTANAFFANIFKHHGLPDNVVSDRDSKFTSKFWGRLMELCGVKLKMSTSRHPQTDGSSEIMNRMVENYLRCYCSYHQNDWDELLPAAEFAYNSAVSEDLGMSPFELDLGWIPKSPLDLLSGNEISVQSVEEFKNRLKTSLEDAKYSYKIAKAAQSAYSSKKFKTPEYKVGSKLWINRSLFKDAYSKSQESDKLTARRFGPFIVKELVGKNAVKLELPDHLKIHPVVHVSHTTPHSEQPSDIAVPIPAIPAPLPALEGQEYEVESILSHRKKGRGYQFLTLMKGSPTHDAEWQPKKDFVDKDGTMNEKFYDYIIKKGILQELH